jgi:hemerythrin
MEIKWEPSMSVGEETIDGQHKKLLTQINKLVNILSSPEVDITQLRETIHFLYTYMQEHFSYEEGYMLKNKYPYLDKHKKMHQEFRDFYTGFQKKLRDRGASPNFSTLDIKEMLEEVKKYLADWLIKHIKSVDQQYAKYIRSHHK